MLKNNEHIVQIIMSDQYRNFNAIYLNEKIIKSESEEVSDDIKNQLLELLSNEDNSLEILSFLFRRDQFFNLFTEAYYYHVSGLVESINRYITYDFPLYRAFIENKSQFFISFTENDYLIAEAFRKLLIAHQIDKDCIYFSSSPNDLHMQPGENYIHNIQHNINESDMIICMLSNNFHESATCYYEIGYATAKEKLILPIYVRENVENGKYFSDKNHIENITSVKYMKKIFAFFGVQLDSNKFSNFVKEIHQIIEF